MKASNLESAKRVVFAATYPETHAEKLRQEDIDIETRCGLEDLGGGSWLFTDEDGTRRVLAVPAKPRKRNGEIRENMPSFPAEDWAIWLEVLEILASDADPKTAIDLADAVAGTIQHDRLRHKAEREIEAYYRHAA